MNDGYCNFYKFCYSFKKVPIPNGRPQTYAEELKRVVAMDPFFVIVIVPSVNADVYKVIKKNLVVENAIPNQVITGQKCLKKDPKTGSLKMAVVTKVAVQIACKLGATPWSVKIPIPNTMMVGFDTYHKKMGDRNSPSIGALTCSFDANCARYWSDVSVHRDGTEMTDGIYRMFVAGLRQYIQINNQAPTRIFFYRDGVGEGQIVQVIILLFAHVVAIYITNISCIRID